MNIYIASSPGSDAPDQSWIGYHQEMDADADADAALPHAVSHDGETTFKCVTWQERGNRKGVPDGWALDHLGPMVRMVAVISCDYKKIWSSLHIQHIYIYV